jgi:hypothetical protein
MKILSYDQIKRRIKRVMGIIPLMHDMCVNTCIGYTSPFENLDTCPICVEPRYHPTSTSDDDVDCVAHNKVPRQQFSTLPIGPQLQALWSQEKSAQDMRYHEQHNDKLFQKLQANSGHIDTYDDFTCGSDYIQAVNDENIKPGDTVLLFSIGRAQLYCNKKSDCWIYIWVIFNLSPDKRYKMKTVVPGGFIPGHNNPKNRNSFMYPSLHHLPLFKKKAYLSGMDSIKRSSRPNTF